MSKREPKKLVWESSNNDMVQIVETTDYKYAELVRELALVDGRRGMFIACEQYSKDKETGERNRKEYASMDLSKDDALKLAAMLVAYANR